MQINSSIPNLIGGVSQQPELLRLPSHMKEQLNSVSSAARGLMKRPGSTHAAVAQASGPGYYEMLDYGPRGVFWLLVAAGVVRLFRQDGPLVTIYDQAGNPSAAPWHTYLSTSGADLSLRAIKEGDTTYLLNTEVTAQVLTTSAQTNATSALAWVKAGNYGRKYRLTVPPYGTVEYETPDGSLAAHVTATDTARIATELVARINAAGATAVVAAGSVIYIPNALDGVAIDDGMGGTASAIVFKSVRSPSELPSSKVPNGFHVKVEGGDATGAGDYYLSFDSSTNVWREVRNPLEAWPKPNSDTMPHMLVPFSDGFKLQPVTWAGRVVGDSETNKGPAFVGRTINDLFFHQDRLGLLSEEGFDFSETGSYYNFYRTTAVDLLDGDPVSGTITSMSKRSVLRHATAFGKRLFLFSDNAQFELQSDPALTPTTGMTQRVADYECSSTVRPAPLGSTLFFPVGRGNYSAFYNMYLEGIDSTAQAADVSSHVPEYIPKGVTKIAVSPVNNMMIALSAVEPDALYVYQFYMSGSERLQSAWHKWDFGVGAIVRAIGVVQTTLHVVVDRPAGSGTATCIERIDLNASPSATRMDRMFTVTASQIAVSGSGLLDKVSSFAMPFPTAFATYCAVVTGDGQRQKKGSVHRLTVADGVASTRADLTGCSLTVGETFVQRVTLGRLLIREEAGKGSAGLSRGRTQVSRMWVNYTDAAAFTVEVAKVGYEPVDYACTAKTLGTTSSTIGLFSLYDGRFSIPIMSRNTTCEITLVNDTPMPSTFLSVDWEGYHVSRGQHV